MPLISVVIPVYQVKDYLRSTIESVRQQSFTDWELILVDDGSTDGSEKICDEAVAADSRIRVIHQPNAGQGPARNTGCDAAAGDYIFYLDSDDTFATDTFDIFKRQIGKNPDLDVVFCGFRMVSSTPARESLIAEPNVIVFETEMQAQEAFLTRRCRFLTPATFYRRQWILDNGLRFKAVPYSEDIFNLWECLMTPGHFAYIDAPIYHYLCRPGSIMTASRLPKILKGFPDFVDLDHRLKSSPLVSEQVKRYMLPRWILGICRSGARLCRWSEYKQLMAGLDARRQLRSLSDFPEKKARLLSLIFRISPRLFHAICSRA